MCVAAGLTLFEVASMFTRPETSEFVRSDLEIILMDAHNDCTCLCDCDPVDSGRTTPSLPSSPISGPLSAGLSAGFTCSTSTVLPVVEECDTPHVLPYVFDVSASGESASPCMEFSCNGPCMPALLTPQATADGASMSCSPEEHLFDPARLSSAARVAPQFFRPLGDGNCMTPAAAQSASGMAITMGPATWGQRGLQRSRRNGWRTKHGKQGNMAAYPPLVPGTHPDQVMYVFTGLTEAQWRDFMDRVEDAVGEELYKNTWKVSRMTGPLVGSCPVTFNDRLR
jgi:hypothetical protein